MLERESIINRAANKQAENPSSGALVDALLGCEKQKAKDLESISLKSLIGTWNLRFITGTKKTRKKAGVILGTGRYIPHLIGISIRYESENPSSNQGKVTNSVKIASIQLSLTGPIEFFPKQRILAFDFTYLKFAIAGKNIYQGYVKQGKQRESEFFSSKLKERAFFKYFSILENAIAARGKGGGLALWSREAC